MQNPERVTGIRTPAGTKVKAMLQRRKINIMKTKLLFVIEIILSIISSFSGLAAVFFIPFLNEKNSSYYFTMWLLIFIVSFASIWKMQAKFGEGSWR